MFFDANLRQHTFLKKKLDSKNPILPWLETRESDGSKRVESVGIHGKVNVFMFRFSKSTSANDLNLSKNTIFLKMIQKVICLDDFDQISLLLEHVIFDLFHIFPKTSKTVQSDFALETVFKISEYWT